MRRKKALIDEQKKGIPHTVYILFGEDSVRDSLFFNLWGVKSGKNMGIILKYRKGKNHPFSE